jgi:hypothetical protein
MSKLAFLGRPWVAFDPSNKEHRQWFYEFTVHNGWGHCPVRFICPDSSGGDLIMMIRNDLVKYYTNREFQKPTPKNTPGRRVVDLPSRKVIKLKR